MHSTHMTHTHVHTKLYYDSVDLSGWKEGQMKFPAGPACGVAPLIPCLARGTALGPKGELDQ